MNALSLSRPVALFRHRAASWRLAGSWRRALSRGRLLDICIPLLVASGLAAAHLGGAFGHLDGRFFDVASGMRAGTASSVVVVERDADFAAGDTNRLERTLARLGVERAGYLAGERAGTGASPIPIIVGRDARYLRAHRAWELDHGAGDGEAVPAARIAIPREGGMARSQIATLPGRGGVVPGFDAALAGAYPDTARFLVPLTPRQSIPVLTAHQILDNQLRPGDLDGTVALIAEPAALVPGLTTALDPNGAAMSEAVFRAHAIHALRTGRDAARLPGWLAAAVLLTFAALLTALFRWSDPKRIAFVVPTVGSVALGAIGLIALFAANILLPVAGLIATAWTVTFVAIVMRETSQDLMLERSASRAIETSFDRSALREGVRLPEFLGSAARYAGIERSLLLEQAPDGIVRALAEQNASIDDIAASKSRLNAFLKTVRRKGGLHDASDLVPDWEGDTRIAWVGSNTTRLFWLHSRETHLTTARTERLMDGIMSGFRELFRWRAELGGRARRQTIDKRVSSAIRLVASESAQVRGGFDAIDTAVVVFHLLGSPLHANAAMQALYAEAGLDVYDTSLADALLALTDLEERRVHAMIENLMIDGTEMRMPMRQLADTDRPSERLLRIAAPRSSSRRSDASVDQVLVLEAIDMRDANRAANLRKAVAKFIDLQLRNDFEAIMLGSQLAGNPRLASEQVRGVVEQIDATARRATGRLNEVAALVRAETADLLEACYPVDATAIVQDAVGKAQPLAADLGVEISVEHPGLSGFTLAEPSGLTDLLVAMLRVVIADTPQGESVTCRLEEQRGHTRIAISGGFGIGFGRLLWLVSNYEDHAVGEYRVIGEGIAKVTRWSASVSYWGSETGGFGFNVDLKGVG